MMCENMLEASLAIWSVLMSIPEADHRYHTRAPMGCDKRQHKSMGRLQSQHHVCLFFWLCEIFLKLFDGTSLVAQWLRIHLPMQGTRV